LKETSLRTGLMFTPQCWLVTQGRPMYRVDFMVYYGGQAVAVEVDGHESDENKADRNRDSARDRFLVQRGIQTIRFTESQITADVGACVEELGLDSSGNGESTSWLPCVEGFQRRNMGPARARRDCSRCGSRSKMRCTKADG
jgi:very-short-patch-repair endonuclease